MFKIIKNNYNYILFILLIFLNYNIVNYINNTSQDIIKDQSKLNVNNIYECLLKEKNNFNLCAKYSKVFSPQGDVFIMDRKSKKIIFDASSDCKLDENKSYLKNGYICNLFYDKKSCINAANILSTEDKGYLKWEFIKNSPEIITFKKHDNYIIAQGGIVNDVKKYFNILFLYLFIFDIVIIFLIFRK